MPPHLHEALYHQLVADLTRDHRRFRLIDKAQSRLSRVIDRALRVLTFGGQNRYLTAYVTTLGSRIYVPSDWERIPFGRRYCILRHEAVHVRQFRRWTWLGMIILYIFFPIPAGFAAGRAWLEWQGYRETLVATWQVDGPAAARAPALEDEIVRRFTGPDYGWMWLRGASIRQRIRRTLAALAEGPPPPLSPTVAQGGP